MSLEEFVDSIITGNLGVCGAGGRRAYIHHLQQSLISSFRPKNNKCNYFHTNDLNKIWIDYFGIDPSDRYIINKSKYEQELTPKQIEAIKNYYKGEYRFLEKVSKK